MSANSIDSSPSKSNNSIHAARLRRRNKRLKTDQSVKINSNQVQNHESFHNLLKEFYENSDDEPAEKQKSLIDKPAILKNFKPFELEKSLAMADHIFVQQFNENGETNTFPATQGFVICTNLPKANNSEKNFKNDSFEITESELINCCHQAEKVINVDSEKPDSKLNELTPKKNDMTLINSILEDFSQSPLGRDQIITNISWEHSPEFRIRRPPVKSYSNKYLKCRTTNLVKRFEETDTRHSSELEDDVSCCSSLSVQEDDAFDENPNNQTVTTSLNTTDRLRENLLNLSEHFTHNEINQSFIEDEQQCTNELCTSNKSNDMILNMPKISDLINEILSFRLIHSNDLLDDSYDSLDDFKGFPNSQDIEDINNIEEKNTICNSLKDKKENAFLPEWNSDDCPDFFADINTESILEQNNKNILNNEMKNVEVDSFVPESTNNDETFTVPNVSNLKPTTSNFIGFTTASSKPIKVSREAHIVAAKILSNLPEIPGLTESTSSKNCDNKTINKKDENIFDNLEDYEWNDDCDLFLNFKTPMIHQEKPETNGEIKLTGLPESTKHYQDEPSTSKMLTMGFTTAAGKNIHATSKGQAAVQELLNEFAGEINTKNYEDELKEMKVKAYAKTHNLKTASSSVSDIKQMNNDVANHKAKDKDNLKTIANFDIEEKLVKPTNNEKSSHNCTEVQNSENKLLQEFEETSSEHFLTNLEIIECEKQNMKAEHFTTGFQTGHGKKIAISEKAQQMAQNFLKEFDNETDMEIFEKNLIDLKTKVQIKNKNLKTVSFEQPNMEVNIHINKGFQTAGGKDISISAQAKQTVEKLLKEFNTKFDVENCEKDLIDLKTKILNKNKDIKQKAVSTELNKSDCSLNSNRSDDHPNENSAEIVTVVEQNMHTNNLNSNINNGFQTANGKQVFISTKAKQTVENLLKEFNNNLIVETSEQDLKDLKTKILNKNIKLKAANKNVCSQNDMKGKADDQENKESTEFLGDEEQNINIEIQTPNSNTQNSESQSQNHIDENLLKEFNIDVDVETCAKELQPNKTCCSPKQSYIETPKLKTSKRKYSADNSNLETPTIEQPEKLFKHKLQTSRSSLVEQSLKSPLATATHSIISRKNLLSLTKKRKNKGNTLTKTPTVSISETCNNLNDLNGYIETPTKSTIPFKSELAAPETPNLKEFLTNAALTSTPQNHKPLSSIQTFEDSDLKPIIWKNDSLSNKTKNNSLNASRLSNNSSTNISFISPNPTPKERIGRLKMYGKAPDVAPILIEKNHNCRPSGLRRTRSMLKKNEK